MDEDDERCMMGWRCFGMVADGSVGFHLPDRVGYGLDMADVHTFDPSGVENQRSFAIRLRICDPSGVLGISNLTFLQTFGLPWRVLLGRMGMCGAMYCMVANFAESVPYGTWTWKEN